MKCSFVPPCLLSQGFQELLRGRAEDWSRHVADRRTHNYQQSFWQLGLGCCSGVWLFSGWRSPLGVYGCSCPIVGRPEDFSAGLRAALLPGDPPWCISHWLLCHRNVLLTPKLPFPASCQSCLCPAWSPNGIGEGFCAAISLFKTIPSIFLPSVSLRRKQARNNNKLKLLPNQHRNQRCLLSLQATIRCHQQIWAACLGCSLSSLED